METKPERMIPEGEYNTVLTEITARGLKYRIVDGPQRGKTLIVAHQRHVRLRVKHTTLEDRQYYLVKAIHGN